MNNLSLAYDKTFNCVQCGMCLPTCPTYLTLKEEKHSPRGRINLLKMYTKKQLTIEDIKDGFDACLGCLECQTVCPTEVDYEYIHHTALELLKDKEKKENPLKYYSFKGVLKGTINQKKSLKLMKKTLKYSQKTIKQSNPLLKLIPKKERLMYLSLPTNQYIKENSHLKNGGITVVYFKGCVMDVMFEEINRKAVELLKYLGVNVLTVENEICCGALQNHAGYTEDAKMLARKNIEVFENIECDYIVNSIGGCGATLKQYPSFFDKSENVMRQKAIKFSEKNIDISVLLNKLNINYNKELPYTITYQPSCHLRNVQKVIDVPENIMKNIPGLTYIELEEKNICCGSAGIYNIVQYNNSMKILDRKMEMVKTNSASVIVTSNPGCYIQMQLGVIREGLEDKISVKHIVDLVYEACDL